MWGAQCVVVRGSGNFETKVISSSSELNWSTNISIEAMSSDDMDKIMDSIMSLSTLSIAFLHHEFTSKLHAVHFLRKLREEGDNPILYSTKTPFEYIHRVEAFVGVHITRIAHPCAIG